MTQSVPLANVAVVGRDAAAWMTANALLAAFGATGLTVDVVELPSLLRHTDTVASLPPLEAFHGLIGLNEVDFMRACSATFSMGQSFSGFGGADGAWFHPYSTHGVRIGRHPFLPFWVKGRHGGLKVPFEDFSLGAAAAKQNHFFKASNETELFAQCDYGYHFAAKPYVEVLKGMALRRGARLTPARSIAVKRNSTGGDIANIIVDGATDLRADLFIDASGREAALIGRALGTPIEDWSNWFRADRILSAPASAFKIVPPYGRSQALERGYAHVVAARDRASITYAFQSDGFSDEAALREIAMTMSLSPGKDVLVDAFQPGRRQTPWVGNCVAIGEAAVSFDPIDAPALHAIQAGLSQLVNLFPIDQHMSRVAKDYNAQVCRTYDNIRDFQVAHFKLNQIKHSDFWLGLRKMACPPTLAHKIAAFGARGLLPVYDDETFLPDSWQAVFLGHGLIPETYDPLIDDVSEAVVMEAFQSMLRFIAGQVSAMSSHQSYLELHSPVMP